MQGVSRTRSGGGGRRHGGGWGRATGVIAGFNICGGVVRPTPFCHIGHAESPVNTVPLDRGGQSHLPARVRHPARGIAGISGESAVDRRPADREATRIHHRDRCV